jgi:hypothetical protein
MAGKLSNHERLMSGELPGRKSRPLPDEFGAAADWMGFQGAPKPSVQIPAEPDNALAGLDQATWTEAAKVPAPPPAGMYLLVCTACWSYKPKGGGPPLLACVWTVGEGVHRGKTVFQSLALMAKSEAGRKGALNWLRRIWAAAGQSADRLPTKPDDLKGLAVGGTVAHRPHWERPNEAAAYIQSVFKPPEP